MKKYKKSFFLLSFFSIFFHSFLLCKPEKPLVLHGTAFFENEKVHCSDKVWIDWDSFSIGKNESIEFLQPNKNSLAVNRITGSSLSSLMGKIKANGSLFLLNPHGIILGKEGVIDTSQFLASTLSLEPFFDKNGLNKNLLFKGNSSSIEINGQIFASEGDIFLLGKNISLKGSLNAPLGGVYMGVGKEIILSFSENEKIFIKTGLEELKGSIDVSGEVKTNQLVLKGEGPLFSLAIKETGCLEATGVVKLPGKILLLTEQGKIEIEGRVTSVENETERSLLTVLGKEIEVFPAAILSTSGDKGGDIFIGGDFQGEQKKVPFIAEKIHIHENAFIEANSLVDKGGEVILFAKESMIFQGNIESKGVDGGLVEVSGKNSLLFDGRVSTLPWNETLGKAGTLLLDPTDITISNGPDSGTMSGSSPFQDTTTTPSNLNRVTLETALGLGNVIIQTTPGVTPGSLGDITLVAGTSLNFFSGNSLTLNADNNIYIYGEINNFLLSDINFNSKNIYIGDVSLTSDVNINAKNLNFITTNDIVLQGGLSSSAVSLSSQQNSIFQSQNNISFLTGSSTLTSVIVIATGNLSILATNDVLFQHSVYPNTNNLQLSANGGTLAINAKNITADLSSAAGNTLYITSSGALTLIATESISLNAGGGINSIFNCSSTASFLSLLAPTIDLLGGAGTSSQFTVQSSGNMVIQADSEIQIFAGTGDSSSLDILSGVGSTCLIDSGGDLLIYGSDALGMVNNFVGGTLSITANGSSLTLSAGNQLSFLAGAYQDSSLSIQSFGNLIINTSSTFLAQGGKGDNAFLTITGSSNLNSVNIIANSGSILGGSGNFSSINLTANQNLNIACDQVLLVQGGGVSSSVDIMAQGDFQINNSIGFVIFQGGSDLAYVSCAVSGSSLINANSLSFLGGVGADASTQFLSGGAIVINLTGDLHLLSQSSGSYSLIQSNITADVLDIFSINIEGNALLEATGDNFSRIFSLRNLEMNVNGDIILDSHDLGNVNIGSDPFTNINSLNGSIFLIGSSSPLGTNPYGTGSSLIYASLGDVEVNAKGNIHLFEGGTVNTGGGINSGGETSVLAGSSILLERHTVILGLGKIDLVCDALYPTSPLLGPGYISLLDTSQITSTNFAPISLYTSKREQNTLEGTLNGVFFVPGPLFVNSSSEVWQTYYPSSLGVFPYTVFYKNFYVPPPPINSINDQVLQRMGINETVAPDLFSKVSVEDSEMFFIYQIEKESSNLNVLEEGEMVEDCFVFPYYEPYKEENKQVLEESRGNQASFEERQERNEIAFQEKIEEIEIAPEPLKEPVFYAPKKIWQKEAKNDKEVYKYVLSNKETSFQETVQNLSSESKQKLIEEIYTEKGFLVALQVCEKMEDAHPDVMFFSLGLLLIKDKLKEEAAFIFNRLEDVKKKYGQELLKEAI